MGYWTSFCLKKFLSTKIVIKGKENIINNDDADAQCTMVLSMENFMSMAAGELDGTAAFMSGKLKIQGDMGIAMKLGPMLA